MPSNKNVQNALMENIRSTLDLLGEDTSREGLVDTPKRYAKSMEFLTSGYQKDLFQVVGKALYHEPSGNMVIVKDLQLFSLCEHHLLPFYGKCHVAYVPDGTIIGLSKIPRIIELFSRRLQVQERLTQQIAEALDEVLKPKGVAVRVEAAHFCMMMRGVEKHTSYTVTQATLGEFQKSAALRREWWELLRTN